MARQARIVAATNHLVRFVDTARTIAKLAHTMRARNGTSVMKVKLSMKKIGFTANVAVPSTASCRDILSSRRSQ
jgi:hypothetical protein